MYLILKFDHVNTVLTFKTKEIEYNQKIEDILI